MASTVDRNLRATIFDLETGFNVLIKLKWDSRLVPHGVFSSKKPLCRGDAVTLCSEDCLMNGQLQWIWLLKMMFTHGYNWG
jgi:hypothetical protein